MTDVFTREKRSQVMARVKGKDTTPELAVRRLLTKMGLRYRLHRADLPGKPDVVMAGRRTVVCVHGCFWHGHDCARGARMPKANNAYWQAKIGRNRERDARNRDALAEAGWKTITVWECELKDEAKLGKRLKRALKL